MDEKKFKELKENCTGAPMNRLFDMLLEAFNDFDKLVRQVGLGGKLKDDIITSKLALDELYTRLYARHHFDVNLEKEDDIYDSS